MLFITKMPLSADFEKMEHNPFAIHKNCILQRSVPHRPLTSNTLFSTAPLLQHPVLRSPPQCQPPHTIMYVAFFFQTVSYLTTLKPPDNRGPHQRQWVDRAHKALQNCRVPLRSRYDDYITSVDPNYVPASPIELVGTLFAMGANEDNLEEYLEMHNRSFQEVLDLGGGKLSILGVHKIALCSLCNL